MNPSAIGSGLLALVVIVYLAYTLAFPERF